MPIYGRGQVYSTKGHLPYHMPLELELIGKYAGICGGPVLDIACCGGRVTQYLAKNGYTVVGLDASYPALELAVRERASLPPEVRHRMHFVQGDMFRFHFREQFPLIVIAYYSFWFNIDRSDKKQAEKDAYQCLERVSENLLPGGIFLIDRPFRYYQNERAWWEEAGRTFGFKFDYTVYCGKDPCPREEMCVYKMAVCQKYH